MTDCPVCGAQDTRPFQSVGGRDYHRCGTCGATFLDRGQLPSLGEAVTHYTHHRNDAGDPAYRRFLSRVATPLKAVLAPGSRGLDYGCGPGPALAAMLEEAGHTMALYDPIFQPNQSVFETTYDFITCTEVAEHFHRPAEEFARLGRLLNPGGWLAVMTCFQTDDTRFATWHYRRDPTHVVFYSEVTLRHVAGLHGWSCTVPARDVVLMRRDGGGRPDNPAAETEMGDGGTRPTN